MNAPDLPFAEESRKCRAAQREWAARPVRDRLAPLAALRPLLVRRAADLCAAVGRDIGRAPDEVLASDVLPTADACKFLQRNAESVLRPQKVRTSDRPLWLMGSRDTVRRIPHGVVGVIGTWNYPVFLNGVQIVQALTAGNGVLWKPSELAGGSAAVLADLLREAGYPPGLVQVVPATREAGPQLAEADVDHVVFTGSANVGRALARRLGERLVPSTLELSGCDAMIVLADADLDMAAKAAWFGATANSGQTCIAVRRVFVETPRYAEFVDRLAPLAAAARPLKLALESQAKHADRLVREAVAAGARALPPGEPLGGGPAECRPTVVADARPDMSVCREATFAPVFAVLPTTGLDAALADNDGCPYALGASVFTADPAKAERAVGRLGAGLVTVNDVLVAAGHPATPFGGRRDSGWGTTQGADGLLAMTIPQAVSVRSGTFRPHYASDPTKRDAVADTVAGLLAAAHGGTLGERWRGVLKMVGGMRRS